MRRSAFLLALALVLGHTFPALAQQPAANAPRLTKLAYVNLETSKGTVILQLDGADAPVSAGNFLDLVKRNFYNGLTFHRVVPGFVAQGGDPKGNGTGGFIDPKTQKERNIPLEIKVEGQKEPTYGAEVPNSQVTLPHKKGALAWARSQDPNSASSQFYIALSDIRQLDGRYAVFGKVVKGMEVVEKLAEGDKILKASVLNIKQK
jgi:cyclophilin family peptidyl-prolyl cis-trans isomerase